LKNIKTNKKSLAMQGFFDFWLTSVPRLINFFTVSISPFAIETQKGFTLKIASTVVTVLLGITGFAFTVTIEKHNAIAEIMNVFFMMKDFN
jgi:hypothetical protein